MRQFYVILTRPYVLLLDNCLCVFNEFLISTYIEFFILLTDYNQSEEYRTLASFGLIGVLGVYFGINILVFLGRICHILYLKIRPKCIAY